MCDTVAVITKLRHTYYMKHLIMILIVTTLTACGKEPSTVGSSTTPSSPPVAVSNNASPTPTPSSGPSVTATPTPTPSVTPTCATFSNTVWLNRASGMIDKVDNVAGVFTVNYMTFSCTRTMSQGVPVSSGPYADPLSLTWSTGAGTGCGSVPAWIQFEVTSCNVMTATIRDGMGSVLETAIYDAQ